MNSNLLLEFCGRALKYTAATQHFAFIGGTGSGKTVCIRLLLESIWGISTAHGVPTRMVIYDSKRELLPIIHGVFEHLGRTDAAEKITLFNPFDRRGVAWDICKDIRKVVHAQEVATLLIPSASGDGKFWTDSAQEIMAAVITSFIQHRTQWDLRDLVLALGDEATIRAITERRADTKRVVENKLAEQRTAAGVLATLSAALHPWRAIAIEWQKATRKVSLREWLKSGEGVLVLGSAETAETAVQTLNAVLVKRLSQLVLETQPEVPRDDPRRIWFVLDEFVRAGKLPGTVELATKGRSKGVCLVLGFQDLDGLRAIYGREVAHEILGQCSNIALLRLNSVATAEWAAEVIGKYRAIERRYGVSHSVSSAGFGSHSAAESVDESLIERLSVLPSYFQNIAPLDESEGIGVIAKTPYWLDKDGFEACELSVTRGQLFDEGDLWSASDRVIGYDYADTPEWDDSDDWIPEMLDEWTKADYERLEFEAPTGEWKRVYDPNSKTEPGADGGSTRGRTNAGRADDALSRGLN